LSLAGFSPLIREWFAERFGSATPPQAAGWPAIQRGEHTLIAAPTGSGKTLAAFLTAIDALFAEGNELPQETRVVYVSPLKALGNDVQRNLLRPLEELRARAPSFARDRGAGAQRRHTAERAAAHDQAPAADPGDDAGVALPAADVQGRSLDPRHGGARSSSTRSTR
jgi:Rad3-related DNA helicase